MNREHCRSRDLKNTYLWVNREGHYGERYEEILLRRQSIPGLLCFYEIEENDEKGLMWNHWLVVGWTANILPVLYNHLYG